MADNAPNPADLQAQVDRLSAFAGSVRKALALGDDADDAAILAALGNTTKERDEHKARADAVAAERAAERIDAAISAALSKSGMIQANTPDAMNLMRPLFTLDDKGRVVTKGGDTGEAPGMDPAQFVAGRLGTLRGHWFPVSVSGGARGGGYTPPSGPDASCFKTGNVTGMMNYIGTHGEQAAIAACRRQGITPPAWLTKGVR